MAEQSLPKTSPSIKICSKPECSQKHYARGFCYRHYREWKRGCDPKRHNARFWSYINITADPTECWVWMRSKSCGYGSFSYLGQTWRAHRLAWYLTHGETPKGLILHACDNPPCCNPNHLREGTQAENMADINRKGRRTNLGSSHYLARLTENIVRDARNRVANGEGIRSLAREYQVSSGSIRQAVKRKTWKHIQ